MTAEFTGTAHGGFLRATYPHAVHGPENAGFLQSRRLSITLHGGNDTSLVTLRDVIPGQPTLTITGLTKQNSGGVAANFAHYFVAAIYAGPNGDEPVTASLNPVCCLLSLLSLLSVCTWCSLSKSL
jgi:hypothetical protein